MCVKLLNSVRSGAGVTGAVCVTSRLSVISQGDVTAGKTVTSRLSVILLIFFSSVLFACSPLQKPKLERPIFEDVYDHLQVADTVQGSADVREPVLSVSVHRMPLDQFVRFVATETGVSVVVDSSLDDRLVSLEVTDVPVSVVLGTVARRFESQMTVMAGVYYLGRLKAEDRAILVRRVGRLSTDDLKTAVEVYLSEHGAVTAYEGGLVVVGDRVDVLTRISDVLRQIESAPIDSWVVQIVMIGFERQSFDDWGLDTAAAAQIAAVVATSSAGVPTGVDVTASLDAVLRAERSRDDVDVVARPLVVIVDGGESNLRSIEQFPVILQRVSDEGISTSADLEFVDVGFDLSLQLRSINADRARLSVALDVSDLAGVVQDVPVASRQSVSTALVVQSAGVYLIGQIERHEKTRAVTGPLALRFKREDSWGLLQVWGRTFRVR